MRLLTGFAGLLHEFTDLLAWLEYSLTLNRQPAVGISHPYSAKYTCRNDQRRGLFFLSAALIVAIPKKRKCPPMPVSFSTTAKAVVRFLVRFQGTAVCTAPTVITNARPSSRVMVVVAERLLADD